MTKVEHHPFVTVRLEPTQVELAEMRLWELGATGLEQRDSTTIVRETMPGEVVILAAFGDESSARHAVESLRPDYRVELQYVPHQNWATEWRKGFGPQRIGTRILLHPSWEPVRSEPDDVVLEIDPENAFGSGDHETTRLVLRLLDERVTGGERVLDVGCGSGILSIAAVRLGAVLSTGIDVEEDAVTVSRRNAELNGVASVTSFSTRSLAEVHGPYDLVLANIETQILIDMRKLLQSVMAPGGTLILSGILNRERHDLLRAYADMNLEELREEGEWCACVLRKAGL
jgi:ribosomal protein L11 methyltransferase